MDSTDLVNTLHFLGWPAGDMSRSLTHEPTYHSHMASQDGSHLYRSAAAHSYRDELHAARTGSAHTHRRMNSQPTCRRTISEHYSDDERYPKFILAPKPVRAVREMPIRFPKFVQTEYFYRRLEYYSMEERNVEEEEEIHSETWEDEIDLRNEMHDLPPFNDSDPIDCDVERCTDGQGMIIDDEEERPRRGETHFRRTPVRRLPSPLAANIVDATRNLRLKSETQHEVIVVDSDSSDEELDLEELETIDISIAIEDHDDEERVIWDEDSVYEGDAMEVVEEAVDAAQEAGALDVVELSDYEPSSADSDATDEDDDLGSWYHVDASDREGIACPPVMMLNPKIWRQLLELNELTRPDVAVEGAALVNTHFGDCFMELTQDSEAMADEEGYMTAQMN